MCSSFCANNNTVHRRQTYDPIPICMCDFGLQCSYRQQHGLKSDSLKIENQFRHQNPVHRTLFMDDNAFDNHHHYLNIEELAEYMKSIPSSVFVFFWLYLIISGKVMRNRGNLYSLNQ